MTSTITRSAAITAICLVPLASPAQSTKPPTCDAPEHRQFDFWLGDWDVTTPDGKPAGRNAITRELNGCVLHERWAGAGGTKGESFNIWDRVSKQWHQTWVSDNGALLLLTGRFENGVMELTGTSGAATARRSTGFGGHRRQTAPSVSTGKSRAMAARPGRPRSTGGIAVRSQRADGSRSSLQCR